MTKGDELIVGNAAAAAYVGLRPDTWRPYVKRGKAPQPDDRVISGGFALPAWRRSTLDSWIRSRPGQGARTDLHQTDAREG